MFSAAFPRVCPGQHGVWRPLLGRTSDLDTLGPAQRQDGSLGKDSPVHRLGQLNWAPVSFTHPEQLAQACSEARLPCCSQPSALGLLTLLCLCWPGADMPRAGSWPDLPQVPWPPAPLLCSQLSKQQRAHSRQKCFLLTGFSFKISI